MSTRLTPEQIQAARQAAESFNPGFEAYTVDYSKVDADRRKGTIMGFKRGGEFLGQFTTHEKAIEAGASVTRIKSIWFLWDATPSRVHISLASPRQWRTFSKGAAAARELGHELHSDWSKNVHGFHAHCKNCGRLVTAKVSKGEIGGDALDGRCNPLKK